MKLPLSVVVLILVLSGPAVQAQQSTQSIFQVRRDEAMKHDPQDVCTDLVKKVKAGEVKLDTSDRLNFTRNLLTELDVPISSQLLVFSGTASQGSRVNAANPRAIYFNDEAYVGVVPGGFVEMIGVDPQFGPVLYSYERLTPGEVPMPVRSADCFRCHNVNGAPAMFTRAVIPFASGVSHRFIRSGDEGHRVSFMGRFGGVHVTSTRPIGPTKEGLLAEKTSNGVRVVHIKPGDRYDLKMHLSASSDIVAHLVHDHQMGFVNRVAELVTYARDGRLGSSANTRPVQPERVEVLVRELVNHVLFADEAALPAGGVGGSAEFQRDFARNRKPAKSGASLKDFDLQTRMFKYRCSYMIYTRQWREMPAPVKSRVYAQMKEALSGQDAEYSYFTPEERATIVQILRETVPDLPADWH